MPRIVGLAIGPESAASSPAGVFTPASRPSSGPARSRNPLRVLSSSSRGARLAANLVLHDSSSGSPPFSWRPPSESPPPVPPMAMPVEVRLSFQPGPVGAHLGAARLGLYFWGLRQEPVPSRGSLAQWPSLGWIPSTPSLGAALTAAQPYLLSASCSQGSFPFF